ncbi:MAG: hypothetical protein NDJ89_11105 [Oligoflexia bacterium]|nr:hypothetical protein [Oligoflexia bacterium]
MKPLLFLGVLTALFGALFLADFGGAFKRGATPVATLADSRGSLRRLIHGELTWDWLWRGAGLGSGDAISTGERSAGRIRFHEGSELLLGPSSLVVLGGEPSALELWFVQGASGARLRRTAKAALKIHGEAPAETEVLPEPDAALSEPWSIPAAVGARAPSALEAAGQFVSTQALPAVPELTSPDVVGFHDQSFGREIRLEWRYPVSAARMVFEVTVATGEQASPVRSWRTGEPSLRIRDLSEGVYLWRVRAIDRAGVSGPASRANWLIVKGPRSLAKPVLLPEVIERGSD